MTPEQKAKARVAQIFAALSAYPLDARWHELVRGGFESTVSIESGHLTAHVGNDGEYAVYFEKGEKSLFTLASGRFGDVEAGGACDQKPAEARTKAKADFLREYGGTIA